MHKVLFYCQHILGMGHLVRSMEIVRSLLPDFQVCFLNGGQAIEAFQFPPELEVVQLPAIETDPEFSELKPVDPSLSLEDVQALRCQQILNSFDRLLPDILIVELFPFGRRRFSFELIPLLERAKAAGTKVVCSLRDIVVTKPHKQQKNEAKICKFMNEYFDLLLVHGDPKFIQLEETFSRVNDLKCDIIYTGYVGQKTIDRPEIKLQTASILASVGGGRVGHGLLECVGHSAPLLASQILHHLYVFTGPFAPDSLLTNLQNLAEGQSNITVDRYTSDFLSYMQQADLSISMSGYNTTMNVLMTGTRSMMMAFTGNEDREQLMRSQRLEKLGRIQTIIPEDLQPENFANLVISYLKTEPNPIQFNFDGADTTATYLKNLIRDRVLVA
ncbi:MAG: glycosyltransferase [Geitlerinemataceae cyanobacterium]